MVIIVSLFSFVLEFLINYFFHGTKFVGLIIFSSLILLEPYFKNDSRNFFIFCFLLGFIYDFAYTGFYFMNAGLFLLIGFIVSYINRVTPNNLIVSILELLFMIVFYRFLSFSFLCLNGVIVADVGVFFSSIYSSIIVSLFYGLVLYFVLYLLSLRFNIRRIN